MQNRASSLFAATQRKRGSCHSYVDDVIESSRSEQRVIDHIESIRGGHDEHSL